MNNNDFRRALIRGAESHGFSVKKVSHKGVECHMTDSNGGRAGVFQIGSLNAPQGSVRIFLWAKEGDSRANELLVKKDPQGLKMALTFVLPNVSQKPKKAAPAQLKKEFLETLAELAKQGDPVFDADQNHTYSVEEGVICFRTLGGSLVASYILEPVK